MKAGQYIIVLPLTETQRASVLWRRVPAPGIYRLHFRTCCDSFQTCNHAGKALCVGNKIYNKWYSTLTPVFEESFDTKTQAEMVAKLLGLL